MLPDLRVVIITVISTFLLTVSAGFYTSSRLLNEPRKARSESLASLEDSPISRIALNWPEPVQQTPQLDLDFAVTLNGSRNPVRDITNEAIETQAELKTPAPRTTARDAVATNQAPSTNETAAKTDEPATKTPEPVPAEEPASIQAARDILTAPALEIEPSTSGLPLVTQGAEAIVTPPRPPVEETTAALMIPAPRTDTQTTPPDEQITESEKPAATAEINSDNQSDPDETGTITVQDDGIPMPQAKPERAGPAPKKSIIVTKQTRKHVRSTQKRFRARLKKPAPAPTTTLFFPFNLFALQPNQFNQPNLPNQFNQPNQSIQFNQAPPTVQTR